MYLPTCLPGPAQNCVPRLPMRFCGPSSRRWQGGDFGRRSINAVFQEEYTRPQRLYAVTPRDLRDRLSWCPWEHTAGGLTWAVGIIIGDSPPGQAFRQGGR